METEHATKKRHGRRYTAEEKARALHGYETSGLTQQEYCARSGVARSNLTNWLRKKRAGSRGDDSADFVEVKLSAGNSGSSCAAYRLGLGTRGWLEVTPKGFDSREVAALAKILREVCEC